MLPKMEAGSKESFNGSALGALMGACPLPLSDYQDIVLAHGSGGKLSQQLIQEILLPQFRNQWLDVQHDGAVFSVNGARLAFSTDSFVVSPIFFPGGDIGRRARLLSAEIVRRHADDQEAAVAVAFPQLLQPRILRRVAALGGGRVTAFAFHFAGLSGGDIQLAEYVGKPILVVNTAAATERACRCGFPRSSLQCAYWGVPACGSPKPLRSGQAGRSLSSR